MHELPVPIREVLVRSILPKRKTVAASRFDGVTTINYLGQLERVAVAAGAGDPELRFRTDVDRGLIARTADVASVVRTPESDVRPFPRSSSSGSILGSSEAGYKIDSELMSTREISDKRDRILSVAEVDHVAWHDAMSSGEAGRSQAISPIPFDGEKPYDARTSMTALATYDSEERCHHTFNRILAAHGDPALAAATETSTPEQRYMARLKAERATEFARIMGDNHEQFRNVEE